MKLEKFKEKNDKKIGILIFTICCILLIAGVYLYSSFAIYEQNQNFNVINGTVEDPGDLYFAFYVDDVISKIMPSKESIYVLDTEKSSCTNGAIPSLDEDTWSIVVENLTTTHTKCTLYFTQSITKQIIAQLDATGSCPSVNEGGTVQVTSAESENGYLCSAPDDYGTSYYYRGNVTNNYVSFAGYYWRILRINGDGSIRMIYDGTSAHVNGEESTDRQISENTYNFSYSDNAYIGYMVGTTGASTYEETHSNLRDSTSKNVLDNWYRSNITNQSLSSYIADTLFCNDRSFAISNTGTGYGTSVTRYRGYETGYDRHPSLYCTQQNDRFTVSSNGIGNGALTYPIGLITIDEAYLAGGYNLTNQQYYLYTGNAFWTMTPFSFDGSYANIRYVYSNGGTDGTSGISNSYGLRPVINLKANSLRSGDGTMENPFSI